MEKDHQNYIIQAQQEAAANKKKKNTTQLLINPNQPNGEEAAKNKSSESELQQVSTCYDFNCIIFY
jgi:hypothetical protein